MSNCGSGFNLAVVVATCYLFLVCHQGITYICGQNAAIVLCCWGFNVFFSIAWSSTESKTKSFFKKNQKNTQKNRPGSSCQRQWTMKNDRIMRFDSLCLSNCFAQLKVWRQQQKNITSTNDLFSSCCQTLWSLRHKTTVAPADIPQTLPSPRDKTNWSLPCHITSAVLWRFN